MATVPYPHIEFAENEVPYIAGTRTKVLEVVLDHLAHGWDAQEVHRQHPHLSLAQVYCALAYYYDHQGELDRQIEAGLESVERIRGELGPSTIRAKLRALGHLP